MEVWALRVAIEALEDDAAGLTWSARQDDAAASEVLARAESCRKAADILRGMLAQRTADNPD